MNDWVATAPTPAFAHGTTAPTAKKRDATPTPHSPVPGSRATMENVATGPSGRCAAAPATAASTATITTVTRYRRVAIGVSSPVG